MRTHNQETQASLTPACALQILKEGNRRFVNNLKIDRNHLQQVNETKEGQWPFATVLSCIDSRTSAELVFDQGLGDIFSIRIAGNVLNTDILGSMEFATKLAGSKLIFVLGHTRCGAIKGACAGVRMGNLTSLLAKVSPIVDELRGTAGPIHEDAFVELVAQQNILNVIKQIPERSGILSDLINEGKIQIAGGLYNVETGVVDFLSPPSTPVHLV